MTLKHLLNNGLLATGFFALALTNAYAQYNRVEVNTPPSQDWVVHKAKAGCLLEMFTSELCAYCQQAEQWLSKNKEKLKAPVFLTPYHVESFDTATEKDPYASPQMTNRHKSYRTLGAVDFIATPQFFYNGIELKNWKEALNRGCESAPRPLGIQTQLDFKVLKDRGYISARTQMTKSTKPGYNVKIHVAVVEHLPKNKAIVRFLSDSLDIDPQGKSFLKQSSFGITPQAQFEVRVFAQNIHTLEVLETWSLPIQEAITQRPPSAGTP